MRILLKIILFPIIIILSVVSCILRLLTVISSNIISTLSMMMTILLILLLVTGRVELSANYPVFIVCFIFSEFGLFGLARLILDGLDNFTAKLVAI